HEVYLFNGRGQSATVVDLKAAKVVATVPLGGKPEFAQADPAAGRVYNNLEDKSEVVAIDIKKHEVVNHWPIAPGESASGMAIDLAHHRLFLGCRNKMMVMMDSTSGKVVVTVPIGRGVDANAFDPGTQLAFSSCGDGTVTIAHEDAPDKLTVVQTLATERGAKTMTLDPKTHRIYLGSAKFDVEILHSGPPVLVDFYTEQCPPCRIISPLIEEIENERGGSLKVIKIDADAEPEFTASFRITSVPTLLLFRGGQRVAQLTGARGKTELQKWIDDSLRDGT